MAKTLLLVPTVDVNLSDRCLSSFYPSLIQTSTTAVVIYNGDDPNVTSHLSIDNIIRLGFEDSETLARRFAERADCPKELLFGEQEFGRSYGGASNLLLAVGCALGGSVMARVDDDCLDLRPLSNSWLSDALRVAKLQGDAHFGHYHGHPSGCLYQLPEDTLVQLVQYIYPDHEHSDRLDLDDKGKAVKNGNLVFTRSMATSACYPVLFDPKVKTHARGEVYHWMHELNELGFSFTYQDCLGLGHYPPEERDINDWLRSIAVGFDLSIIDRIYAKERRYPDRLERQKAVLQFRSWIMKARWPADVVAEDLAALLDEDNAFSFADKILREKPERKSAWHRLMSSDLSVAIRDILPSVPDA